MESLIPETTLSSGKAIPLIGFGTAEFPSTSEEKLKVKQSVLQAIEVGYRHFDTAQVYMSEQPLGDAIAEALHPGLIKSRDELFITTKYFAGNAHALPALQESIKNLGLEYIDPYLIHFPLSLKPGSQFSFEKDKDIVKMDIESVRRGMEKCQDLGLTKSIGVSNFTCKKIETLLSSARIPPALSQVEMNPFWQQKQLRELCEGKGIHMTAYSPLGGKGSPWGANRVMESEVLKEIANGRGKTIGQGGHEREILEWLFPWVLAEKFTITFSPFQWLNRVGYRFLRITENSIRKKKWQRKGLLGIGYRFLRIIENSIRKKKWQRKGLLGIGYRFLRIIETMPSEKRNGKEKVFWALVSVA